MICDMSSDIFSRKVNAKDFTLIYAGAQKNMGAAGSTMVMVKRCTRKNGTQNVKHVRLPSAY